VSAEDRYAQPLALDPGRIVRDHDEPIKVGTMLWVFTDPDRGYEFAYNRWYERDHYYGGCMIGPYHFAGSRWVAPRRHRDARFPVDSPMPFALDAGTYACLYWYLDGHHEEAIDWATPQVHHLYAEDRGFAHRTHYNTATYRHAWRAYRDPDPVPLELALDHRYPGLVTMFVDLADGATPADLDAWFDGYLPTWLPGSPVATVAHWTNVPLRDDKPDFTPVDPAGARRSLLAQFVEGDPLDSWDHQRRLADDLAASGVATVAFAAPFVATEIGTDRYVDELW
jgi:hypothetical protein